MQHTTWTYKIALIPVLFLLLIISIPLVSVLAQEVQEAAQTETSAPESSTPPAPEETAPAKPSEAPAPESGSEADMGGEIGVQNLGDNFGEGEGESQAMSSSYTDPQGGSNQFTTSFTYQNIAPKLDQSTGALTQRIPLDIPPGRKGVQPDLALLYNSQQLEDSMVGYGWTLSTPYIERLNKAGSERMYADGYYTSSMSGELATTTSTSTPTEYRAKIDDGKFIRYFLSGDVWTAYDKNGTRYSFGTTTAGQLAATTSPSAVYKWMLQEIRDSNGNYVTYTYTRDGNQLYPSTITYTGNGTTDGVFTVEFTTEARPDPIISYKSGFRVVTYYRISRVQAKVSGTVVRTYDLDYTTGHNGYRSLLSSVTLTGTSNGSDLALPPLTFTYASTSASLAVSTDAAIKNSAYVATDVNGDGLSDRLVSYNEAGDVSQHLMQNINGDSFSSGTSDFFSNVWAGTSLGYEEYTVSENGIRTVDINGDGKADVVQSLYDGTYSSTTKQILYNAYATSTSFAWAASTTASTSSIPVFAYMPSGSFRLSVGSFGNFNGDGLVDYVKASVDLGQVPYVGTGSGWTDSSFFSPLHNLPSSNGEPAYNIQLIDINGDGLDDWVETSWPNKQTIVCLNTGTEWDDCDLHYTIATSTLYAVAYGGGSYYWDRGMRFMDVNGDGLVDFVRAYSMPSYTSLADGIPDIEVATINYVLLNTGSGFATSSLTMPSYIATGVVNSGTFSGEVRFAEFANWKDQVTDTTPKQDILTQINYPKGAEVDIGYENSTKSGKNPELPMSILTVTSIDTQDGRGNTQTVDYAYGGGKMYLDQGPRERKFAGFASTTETKSDVVTTRYFNQGDAAQADIGEQTDSYAQIGKVFREDLYPVGSTTPLRKTFTRTSAVNYFGLEQSVSTSSTNYSLDLESDSTQYVTAADSSSLSITGDLTIEFWINPESSLSGLNRHFVNKSGAGADYSYIVYHPSSDTLNLVIQPSNNITVDKGVAFTYDTGSWQHIMATYNASTGDAKFYKNCVQQGSTQTGYPNNIKDSTGMLGLGINTDGLNSGFDGKMDDVRIWNKVKSASECSADYQSEITASSTLKGYWKVNNDYTDASGNSNTLTATNNPTFASSTPFAGTGVATTTGAAILTNLFVYPAKELIQDFDSDGNHRDKAVEYVYATTTGDLLIKTERGEVLGNSDGTYTDTGSDMRTTTYTYAQNTGINLSVPTQKTIANNSSTRIAESKYTYDGLDFGTTTLGNLTKQENWISGSLYASTTAAYNAYGLATTTTDQRGNVTTITYESLNIYPATTTNALGHEVGTVYDYASGQVATKNDPNNTITTYLYDPVGRIITEKQPDLATPSTQVTKISYTYSDNSFPSFVQITQHNSTATSSDLYRYVDGLGRTISERIEAAGDNTYAVKDWVYDSASRLQKQSLPYFASSTSFSSATSTAALFTTYTYDGLDRVLTALTAVGTTTNAYNGWTATTTDPRGKIKGYTKDAYGNLVQVTEKNDSSYYSTNYTYDLLGNLTKITDALANVRNFAYDGLSRRTAAEDLHASGDGTYGTYTYAYDLSGNLASTTDAKAQVVNFTYDSLNRLLTEDYAGGSGTEITYTYDFCGYGKGRLCTASSTGAIASTTYNVLGLPTYATTTIAGVGYQTGFTYDRLGNPLTIAYPSGAEVRYGYDSAGLLYLTEMRASTSTSVYVPVIFGTTYAPTGMPNYRLYGTTTSSTYTFDANELYRLRSIISGTVGTSTSSSTANTYSLNLQESSSQYTTAADSSALSVTGDMTIQFWINPASSLSGLNRHLLNKTPTSSGLNDSYVVYHSGGDGLNLLVNSSTDTTVDQGVPWDPTPGVWNHIMVTYKASTGDVKFYENCAQIGSTQTGYPSNIKDSSGSLKIGANGDVNSFFNGKLDDVRIWNKVLSATECANNFTTEISASTTLKGYWKLNNNYTDASGNAGHLTALNVPTFSTNVPNFTSGLDQTDALQHIAYTYDANGNITKIQDFSTSTAARIAYYTYDDLNRLLYANVGIATSSGYQYYYGYDAVGNILSSTPAGLYTYEGTSYANPHAVTSIATSTGGGDGTSTSTIAFVATSTKTILGYNTSTTTNWTHTVSGTDALVVLTADIWQDTPGAGTITSAKWNGGTMTKATSTRNVGMASEIWYIAATTTGSKQVSVTVTGDTDAIKLVATTFSGIATTSPLDKVSGTLGDSGNPSTSISTAVDGEVAVATLSRFSTTDATTNRTALYKDITGSTLGAASYQLTTTAGSYSDTYTGSSEDDFSMLMAAFKPAVLNSGGGATTTTTLSYDNNGNLITYGTRAYTWDYRNRIAGETHTNASSTYSYDDANQRMKQVTWDSTLGTTTTIYPSKYYSITSTTNGATTVSTTTNYIYAGDTLVATLEQTLVSGAGGGQTATSTIAFSASSTKVSTGFATGASYTWTHTVPTLTNPAVGVCVSLWQDVPGTGSISAAKMNGANLTLGTTTTSGAMRSELWYGIPTTTSNFMSFTVSGNTDDRKWVATSLTGVAQSSPLDAKASKIGSGTHIGTTTTTALTSGDMLLDCVSHYGTQTLTKGTAQTVSATDTTGSTGIGSSYVAATTTGNVTYFTTTGTNDLSYTVMAFKPATTTSGGTTGTTNTYFYFQDHLGSTNVVSDTAGTLKQTLDYYPYGSVRINRNTSTSLANRGYIGQFQDTHTSLSYLQNRYMDPSRGQFLSQDPVFLSIGSPGILQNLTGRSQVDFLSDPQISNTSRTMGGRSSASGSNWSGNMGGSASSRSGWSEYLMDPQTQNSYAYARGNPIRFKDPEGLWYKEFATGQQSWSSFQLELGEAANQLAQDSPTWGYAFSNPNRTSAVVAVGSAAAAYSAAGGIVLGAGFNATNAVVGAINAYGYGQTAQSYLQYKATGSQTARNQTVFDGIVSGAALLGTAQQRQGLNILTAILTALSIDLKNMSSNSGQSTNGSGNTKNGSNTKKKDI